MEQHTKYQSGQLIVELLVAFGLASLLIPAIILGFISASRGRAQQEQRLQATGYLHEAEEATRSLRDANWSNVATNGTYYPKATATGWTWGNVADGTLGAFTRSVVISDITPADPSEKQVTVNVSWSNFFPTTLTSTFILARWKNISYQPITAGGTITGQGHGDWCSPNLHITPYDISGNGVGIAISSIPGASSGSNDGSYITTGNNSSSNSTYSVNISDPDYPTVPVATTNKTYNNGKDYGLFANSNYIYVATGNVPGDSKRVVDILDPTSLTKLGYFDAASNLNAQSVYVDASTGYVTASTNNGSSSYIIAFTATPVNGASSQAQLWQKNLTGNAIGNKVVETGGYAYIATGATSNSQQLQVVRLSDQTLYSPPASGIGSINTSKPGVDIAILGNYAYLVTGYNSGSPNIFIVDISSPTSPKVVGSTNTLYSGTSMDPLGVATTPNNANKLIVVGNGGWQYQTFDVSTPSNPVRCGTPLQNPNGATKIQAVSTLREVDGDVYSYILTTNGSAQQFQIIEGGPGGGGGGNTGTFESTIFDCRTATPACPSPVIFNRFSEVPSPTPAGVVTNYQVAVSADPGCNNASYVYSYTGSFGSTGGPIPLAINPGYCFRYKVTFTNAGNATSASTSVSVNYSP